MSFLTILVSSLAVLGASSQPASKPTTTRSSGDPAVDAVLDRLEQINAPSRVWIDHCSQSFFLRIDESLSFTGI